MEAAGGGGHGSEDDEGDNVSSQDGLNDVSVGADAPSSPAGKQMVSSTYGVAVRDEFRFVDKNGNTSSRP